MTEPFKSAFLQLIRDFLNATFQVLKNNCWEEILVSRMSQLIEEEVMDAVKEEKPDGLRFHLADIYLVELTKLGADEVCIFTVAECNDRYGHYSQIPLATAWRKVGRGGRGMMLEGGSGGGGDAKAFTLRMGYLRMEPHFPRLKLIIPVNLKVVLQ